MKSSTLDMRSLRDRVDRSVRVRVLLASTSGGAKPETGRPQGGGVVHSPLTAHTRERGVTAAWPGTGPYSRVISNGLT